MASEKEGQLVALTQTQHPKLAAVRPQLQPAADGKMELHITAPDMSPIIVPEELPPSSTTVVRYKCVCVYVRAYVRVRTYVCTYTCNDLFPFHV